MSYTIERSAVVIVAGLRLTNGRLAWLQQLADHPGTRRAKGRIGFECMTAGLTTWHDEGAPGEQLSTLGREVLEAARKLD